MNNVAVVSRASPRPTHRDLTNPAHGPHAIQLMLRATVEALARMARCTPILDRASIVPVPAAAFSRALAGAPGKSALLVRPRVVVKGGRPGPAIARHEVEIWWIRPGERLGLRELGRWLGSLAPVAAPGLTVSAIAASVPHAVDGRQLDARVRGTWRAIASCGVVDPGLLRGSGLPDDVTALVLTLDLDRLVLLAKGMDDAGLLSSDEPGVAAQMLDLEPYVPPAMGAPRLLLVGSRSR